MFFSTLLQYMRVSSGYTLIELVVSIGILMLVTVGFLFNSSTLRNGFSATQAAQKISLTFRLAENRSIVAAAQSYSGPGSFPDGYGVYFDKVNMPRCYVLFSDTGATKNGRYDGPADCSLGGEGVEIFTFSEQLAIGDVVSFDSAGVSTSLTQLSVLFRRPDPTLEVWVNSPLVVSAQNHFAVRLNAFDNSFIRTIHVWSTGQISVVKQ